MKYLSFLFLSVCIYAQQPYQDTLFMFNERVYPCYLIYINKSNVKFIYSNNIYELVTLQSISKISMNGHGLIYTPESGFLKDLDTLQIFLESRWEKLAQEKRLREEGEKLLQDSLQSLDYEISENSGSFGVLYIPYSAGKVYHLLNGPSEESTVYSVVDNETRMEGQFAYLISSNTRLTFSLGYTLTFTEKREENHSSVGGSGNSSGYLISENLKFFNFTLGIKSYFSNFLEDQATAYWLAGIGKQIAFANVTRENLFIPDYDNDNAGEYMEDLNSPWQFNLGFGAEYFFNKSLSLFSVMRFTYSTVTAEYNSRTSAGIQSSTSKTNYKDSDIATDIGLGLNFYF